MMKFSLVLSSLFLLNGLPTIAAAAPSPWLDQPLRSWNRQGGTLPAPAGDEWSGMNAQECAAAIRAPQSPAETALQQRGWYLFGTTAQHKTVEIVLGNAGFDGMCRPMAYQAFVFVDGRYAGTLSPELMHSRSDGSLIWDVKFTGDRTFAVEFARYSETDPLCCPSRISTVTYQLRDGRNPRVVATNVTTAPVPPADSSPPTSSLSGQRWQLRRIGDSQAVNLENVFLEFNAEEQRVTGFSGCNYFNGSYRLTGHDLTFGAIASTKRACLQEPIQSIEIKFYEALGQTTRYHLAEGALHFYAGDRLLLTFRPMP